MSYEYSDTRIAICHSCGYDLRGHDQSSVCPECGVENDFVQMRCAALRLVAARRLLPLGPIALLRKRTRAWWWAFDEQVTHASMVAVRNVAFSLLIVAVFALTCGSVYVRISLQIFNWGSAGNAIPVGQDDYLLGPFGEFRPGQFVPMPTYTQATTMNTTRSETIFDVQFERIWDGTSARSAGIVLVGWIWPSWIIPVLFARPRRREHSTNHSKRIRAATLAAFLYESTRLVYFTIAMCLTWPLEMIGRWLFPIHGTVFYIVQLVAVSCIVYNIVAWVQALRSDHAKVLGLSRARIALIAVGYGAVLPSCCYFILRNMASS